MKPLTHLAKKATGNLKVGDIICKGKYEIIVVGTCRQYKKGCDGKPGDYPNNDKCLPNCNGFWYQIKRRGDPILFKDCGYVTEAYYDAPIDDE